MKIRREMHHRKDIILLLIILIKRIPIILILRKFLFINITSIIFLHAKKIQTIIGIGIHLICAEKRKG